MLTVSCCCVSGPSKYMLEHVDRLRKMVKAYLLQDFDFQCITESPWPGWWSKILLFQPGRFKGRVLYFDLDITIVGNLDEVADYPAVFAASRDALNPGINSSVMLWTAGQQDHIYNNFTQADMAKNPFGDQQWIQRIALPSKFPIAWFPSYKLTLNRDLNNLKPDAKAIIFHGLPKPWDLE